MKFSYKQLLVFGICCAQATLAIADSYSSYDFNKGIRFDFEITPEILSINPAWNTEEEYPPLSPRKAAAAAQEQLNDLVDAPASWTMGDIELHQINGSDKWIYIVHFIGSHPPGIIDGPVPTMQLVVLMDGQTVEPKISADEYK